MKDNLSEIASIADDPMWDFDEEKETIEIDISDNDMLKLAKLAHQSDLTINQVVNNILRKHIADSIPKRTAEEIQNDHLEDELRKSVLLCPGVNVEDLIKFGFAYCNYSNNYTGNYSLRNIIFGK